MQNSGEALWFCFQERERGAKRFAGTTKQQPRDGACAQRARRKDNRVGASVVTPVQWEDIYNLGWSSNSVIDGTDFCIEGSSYTGAIIGTSVLNGRD